MGEVWQVDDINYSKRQQETQYKAIKVLPIDLAHSQDHLDLLSDEADLTAELKHSHIINVFGLAESEGSDNKAGIPFILMEYLEGKTLEQYLQNQGVLTWEQAEKWLNQAAGALDYAWTKHHLIHRDLKPGNLFITEDQELILLDFGLAWRIRKSQLSLSNQEVDDSSSRGTVAYMPPEAFANTAPDPRQDVYALACVCYQMLTGETPYPPEAARKRDPELYPDAPKQLNKTAWEILKQGFAYKKVQRPKTAGELIEKLKIAQNKQEKAEPTKPTKPPKPIPVAPIPPKPRVKNNIWIIAVVVGLLATLSYTVLERNKTATESKRKIEQAENAADRAKIAQKRAEQEVEFSKVKVEVKRNSTGPIALDSGDDDYSVPINARKGTGAIALDFGDDSYSVQIKPRKDGGPISLDFGEDIEPARKIAFTVKTSPANARVRILNIAPKYQAGIRLKAGQYKVEVSAPGYQKQTTNFQLNTENTVHFVELQAYQRKVHNTAIPANYSVQGNGTVIDNDTGLHWMRCSLGQVWRNGVCAGNAKKYKWRSALNVAKSYRYAGYSDWRVPTIQELNSLVYCTNGKSIQYGINGVSKYSEGGWGCESKVLGAYQRPVIKQSIFPNAATVSVVWSSSPSAGNSNGAWYVGFYVGGTNSSIRNYGRHVRLVRSGQ